MKTLLITLFMLITSINILNANIIYKNIDSTISATPAEINKGYMLDINNDGINDFYLKHLNHNYFECSISGSNSAGEIQVNQNLTAYMCANGQIISDTPFDAPDNMYYGMGVMDLDWMSGHENILAVRFQIDSVYHYAWIKVIVPINASYLKIIDCAYEDIPGASIPAGKTSTAVIDKNLSNELKIFNQNNEVLKVEFKGDYQPHSAKIFDINGICMKVFVYQDINNLQIDELPNGIYYLAFFYGNQIIVQKFIISK